MAQSRSQKSCHILPFHFRYASAAFNVNTLRSRRCHASAESRQRGRELVAPCARDEANGQILRSRRSIASTIARVSYEHYLTATQAVSILAIIFGH